MLGSYPDNSRVWPSTPCCSTRHRPRIKVLQFTRFADPPLMGWSEPSMAISIFCDNENCTYAGSPIRAMLCLWMRTCFFCRQGFSSTHSPFIICSSLLSIDVAEEGSRTGMWSLILRHSLLAILLFFIPYTAVAIKMLICIEVRCSLNGKPNYPAAFRGKGLREVFGFSPLWTSAGKPLLPKVERYEILAVCMNDLPSFYNGNLVPLHLWKEHGKNSLQVTCLTFLFPFVSVHHGKDPVPLHGKADCEYFVSGWPAPAHNQQPELVQAPAVNIDLVIIEGIEGSWVREDSRRTT